MARVTIEFETDSLEYQLDADAVRALTPGSLRFVVAQAEVYLTAPRIGDGALRSREGTIIGRVRRKG